MLLQQRTDLGAAEQRNQRQREIRQRPVGDKSFAHPFGQLFDAPFHRHARSDDTAHAGPANIIERHARLMQRFQHADMRKTARAAACQYDIHRRASHKARQPFQIGGVPRAHMMMRTKEIVAKLDMLRQTAWACIFGMEQQKLGRGRHLAFEKAPLEWVQRHGFIGAREQQDPIGLTETETRPGAVGLIALVENDVVLGFEPIEPVRRFVAGRTVEHRSLGAHLHHYVGYAADDGGGGQPALQRDHSEGLGTRALMPAARRVPQAADHDLQQIEHDARIARQQHVEGFGPEA